MDYEGWSREQFIARIEALEAERRAALGAAHLHEPHVHQLELELQNESLRETQGALAESHARLRDLYELAPIAYLTLDQNGVILDLNRRAAALLGTERRLVVGKPFLAVARFADATAFHAHLKRCLETIAPAASELRFAAAGRTVEVQAVSSVVLDAAGRPSGTRMALLDVGPQKQLEHDLERSRNAERELRGRVERVSRASIVIIDAIAQMTGGTLSPVLQIVADKARELVDAEFAALGIGGTATEPFEPWCFSGVGADLLARFGSGPRAIGVLAEGARTERPVRLRDLRTHPAFQGFPSGHPEMTSFLAVPIRYRGRGMGTLFLANKRGAAEFSDADEFTLSLLADKVAAALEVGRLLRRERARLALLESAAHVFSAVVEQRPLVDTIGPLLVPLLGDACAVALLDEAGDLRVEATHAREEPGKLAAACVRGEVLAIAGHLRHELLGEGKTRTFDASPDALGLPAGPILLAPLHCDGRAAGVLCLARENAARRFDDDEVSLVAEFAHRAALALANTGLHEVTTRALRARDEMLAFVTHDLGNFLNSIALGSQVLERLGNDPKQVAAIRRAVERMRILLDSLRDAGMLEAGSFRVVPRTEDITTVLRDAVAIIQPRVDAKRIVLSVDVEEGLPLVSCDRERVHQVLANLMGNAVQHTPEGGTITVAVRRSSDAEVRVAVTDNGSGIKSEDVPHVFDRYWRTNTKERAGTGLGLFISQGIVKVHGGDIGLTSAPGLGTTFYFTLPAAARPAVVKAGGNGSPTAHDRAS